jgi:hypothetical protein
MPRDRGLTAKALRRAALICLGMIVFYFAVPVERSISIRGMVIRGVVTVVVLILLVRSINRQLLRLLDSSDAPLGGLLTGIIGGVLFFALVDYIVARHLPGEFVDLNTRIDGLYFALTTLATVGFGDVHAEGQIARAILCVQIVFDVAILATAGSVLLREVGSRRGRGR